MRNPLRWTYGLIPLLAFGLFSTGCATVPGEKNMDERQDQAMKDPFHYSPGDDIPDITGGGIGEFDPKAMQKDLNNVFN